MGVEQSVVLQPVHSKKWPKKTSQNRLRVAYALRTEIDDHRCHQLSIILTNILAR